MPQRDRMAMIEAEAGLPELPGETRRSGWLRLRTLIVLRWIAVAGQAAALAAAVGLFDLAIDLGPCALVIGAAVIANLVMMGVWPRTKRLREGQVLATLLFDTVQLAALLALTGGLNNPFALLILTPVTISATALSPMATAVIGAATIALTSLLTVLHLPLVGLGGEIQQMPRILLFGTWAAIVTGVCFLGLFAWRVTSEQHAMAKALLATQMALAREQKLTDLGGVVAAAAHELGTPLATIKLVSSELADELSDRPELAEDARLIRAQADRCRDILRGMGRAGKDDLHMRHAPPEAVLREAAEPHAGRGVALAIRAAPEPGGAAALQIRRRPEIIHGLRNLIQNAVDFAEREVRIDARWTAERLSVHIIDDGAGFPPTLLDRIGEPFMPRRRQAPAAGGTRRAGYEGMGLGLFIAKTLLERSGAELTFANGPGRGAVVQLVWRLRDLAAPASAPVSAPVSASVPVSAPGAGAGLTRA